MAESMSREEERKRHREARRRATNRRRKVFYIILTLIVIVIGIILSVTVFFNVNRIEVRGYSIYGEDTIIAASGIEKGDNMVALDRDKAENKITSALPYIGSVEFKKSFPDKLVITVHEAGISAAVQVSDGYILIDDYGKMISRAVDLDEVYANAQLLGGAKLNEEETTAEATQEATEEQKEQTAAKYVLNSKQILKVTGTTVTKSDVGQILEFKKEKVIESYQKIMAFFSENDIDGITSINLKDPYNITFMYEDRILIKIGSVLNLTDKKMQAAAIIIKDQDSIGDSQEGTIDLTVGDKKYYFSPKIETTTAATTVPATEVVTNKKGEAVTDAQGNKVTQVVTTTTTQATSTTTTTKKNAN